MAKTATGKITELKQDDRNANRHRQRGKELLQKSIGELGAGRSVLVDANNVLIAGNSTTETAIAEGITKTIVVETTGDELVVVKRTDLDMNDPGESGRKARQMALIDNSSALQGIEWDKDAIEEIESEWGFEAQDWGVELSEEEETVAPSAEDDNYEPPTEIQTDIVLGDLFEFRKGKLRHVLVCGDSLDSDVVAKCMGNNKANMVLTDPPYEIDFDYANTLLFCENANVFVFNNDRALARQLANSPLEFKKFFVFYHAGCAIPQEGGNEAFLDHVLVSHEILGEPLKYQKGDGLRTVIKGEYRRSEFHKHEKPISILEPLLNAYSKQGDTVLDFFAGGGSLFSACHQLERNCMGLELDPKNCQVVVDRLAALDEDIEIYKNGEKYLRN